MRLKKVRGHKRRWDEIENWRNSNLNINLTDYLKNQRNRYYTKIEIRPWNNISITNSKTRQPKGKTKRKILNGLIDIFDNWKKQLETLGQPYYLKIWFFEQRFSQSQVVCAIGDNIDFYNNTFFKPEKDKKIKPDNYSELKNKLENFSWEYRLDEDYYNNTEVGEPEMYVSRQDYEDNKKWFSKLLKKPHRTNKLKKSIGDITEYYSFKRGDIWIGEHK